MLTTLHTKSRKGFTLVEIMIVVAIIALLAAIAVPSFLRARLRSQATTVVNSLRLLDSAKDQYAIENNQTTGTPTGSNVALYLKQGSALYNAADGETDATIDDPKIDGVIYNLNAYDVLPSVTTEGAFDDVTDINFWSPYSKTN